YAAYNYFDGQQMRVNTLPLGINRYIYENANTTGRHKIVTAYDTVTAIRGNHNLTFGGQYRNTVWDDTPELPQTANVTLGRSGSDPVSSIFNANSMPGANNAEYANAAALYAMLVGRISGMNQTAALNSKTLAYNGGVKFTWTASHMGGAFITDRWR